MPAQQILWPVTALAFLTFFVLLLIPAVRLLAVANGSVAGRDFKYGESGSVPGEVSLPNRNYMNLLELPILFYVLCLALFVTDRVDAHYVQLAWAYVAVRAAHSFVHLAYNNVVHRLVVFAASNVVLIVMWIRFVRGMANFGAE